VRAREPACGRIEHRDLRRARGRDHDGVAELRETGERLVGVGCVSGQLRGRDVCERVGIDHDEALAIEHEHRAVID
jgi:hypothetical protein